MTKPSKIGMFIKKLQNKTKNRKKKRKLSTILLSILWISKYGKKVEASTLNLNPIRNKEKKAGGTSKILNFKSIDEFKFFNLIFLL